MNQEVKDKWLKALRSGKYKQGKFALKRADDTFCCLGVLCDLYHKEGNGYWEAPLPPEWHPSFGPPSPQFAPKQSFIAKDGFQEHSNSVLPDSVMEWADLDDIDPDVIESDYTLSTLNDSGSDFNFIADVIEKEL
jgi:hypothetical protein